MWHKGTGNCERERKMSKRLRFGSAQYQIEQQENGRWRAKSEGDEYPFGEPCLSSALRDELVEARALLEQVDALYITHYGGKKGVPLAVRRYLDRTQVSDGSAPAAEASGATHTILPQEDGSVPPQVVEVSCDPRCGDRIYRCSCLNLPCPLGKHVGDERCTELELIGASINRLAEGRRGLVVRRVERPEQKKKERCADCGTDHFISKNSLITYCPAKMTFTCRYCHAVLDKPRFVRVGCSFPSEDWAWDCPGCKRVIYTKVGKRPYD